MTDYSKHTGAMRAKCMRAGAKHTGAMRAAAARAFAVLAAASLLASACTGAADDGTAGDLLSEGTQPAAAAADGSDPAAGSAELGESDGSTADTAATQDAATGDDVSSGDAELDGDAGSDDDSATALSDTAAADAATTGGALEAAGLVRFDECAAALGYIHEHAARAVGPWGFDGGFGLETAAAEEMIFADEEQPAAAPLEPGVDYSTSNVQETGIDEPDAAKTDGRRMVIAGEDRVHIVDVTGPVPTLIASVQLDDRWVSNLLLHGDRVLVFASQWDFVVPFVEPSGTSEDPEFAHGWGPTTGLVEIDLSGATPTVARRLDIEGSYISARMADGVVRVVTSSSPRAFGWAVPQTADLAGQEQAAGANRKVIADSTIEDWLPRYVLSDASGDAVESGRLVSCARIWAPPQYSGPGTLSVTTIDIAADGLAGPMDTTSILSDGATVYASPEYLYVTTTRWHDRRIDPADADQNTPVETEIHMFDTAERAASTYVGSASVTGTVLNQYSLSEHEGHLRIATTTAPAGWRWRADDGPASESMVTVLAIGADGLSEVGSVGGLGVGERIYAVRYLGDIAAVVTFREVDPLYLLDLSDPTAPTVRGELKITGYSAYLHPLGDGLLLGVGQEATGEGRTLGTQVSLFDIADLDRPERIAQWTAPGGRSEVEFNALAFLHWPPSDLAVLPLNQYPLDDTGGEMPFIGAVALGTADRTLAEQARLGHADPSQRTCRESREIAVRPDGSEEPGPWERYCWFDIDWQAQVTASAVVGDRLYLASHRALESISLESLERAALLRWAD